jgi:hypothetical protein
VRFTSSIGTWLAAAVLLLVNSACKKNRPAGISCRGTPAAQARGAEPAGKAGGSFNRGLVNGVPGDSISDFVRSLLSGEKEDRIRLAAWIAYDGLVPLGPDSSAGSWTASVPVMVAARQPFAFRPHRQVPPRWAGRSEAVGGGHSGWARSGIEQFVSDRGLTQSSRFSIG